VVADKSLVDIAPVLYIPFVVKVPVNVVFDATEFGVPILPKYNVELDVEDQNIGLYMIFVKYCVGGLTLVILF
jgi:hypothetical protein